MLALLHASGYCGLAQTLPTHMLTNAAALPCLAHSHGPQWELQPSRELFKFPYQHLSQP